MLLPLYFRDFASRLRGQRKRRPALARVRGLLPVPEHSDGGPVALAHRRQNLGLGGAALPRSLVQAV